MELSEESAELNEYHAKAVNESGSVITAADCFGNVLVAIYYSPDEDAQPEVLTSQSGDDRGFPAELRADSLETARWIAVIHPLYYTIGSYGGDESAPAQRTVTCISLFDVNSGKQYDVKAAEEEPPASMVITGVDPADPAYPGSRNHSRD